MKDWRSFTKELFTPSMRGGWGWGNKKIRPLGEMQLQVPNEHALVVLNGGSLHRPYYSTSRIRIDFSLRMVECYAVDQKTPSSETWKLEPSEKWWQEAWLIEWPVCSTEKPQKCGYCEIYYRESENNESACRHHPQFFSSHSTELEKQYKPGWQCCGGIYSFQRGCVTSPHRADVRKQFEPNGIVYQYVKIETPS